MIPLKNFNLKTGKFRKTCRPSVPIGIVRLMHAEYMAGVSLEAVGRKYRGISGSGVRSLFKVRGFEFRPNKPNAWKKHRANGCFVAAPKATAQQMTRMINDLTKVTVPAALRREWRHWSLVQRRKFIQRVRLRFPSTRPRGPYSANVMPFEYGTPAVHELAAKMNVGRDSRTKVISLKPSTEGVIWKERIFFWAEWSYVSGGGWDPAIGRPSLGHLIWAEANCREVPAQHMVVHADGNKNNFEPDNLLLRSMAQNAQLNHWKHKPLPAQLLVIDRAHATRQQTLAERARRQTAAVLQRFQAPDTTTTLLAALEGRGS